MENENTEGKVSNMCVCINLKTYSGIQEINFLLLLQVFFLWLFWLKGLFFLSCTWLLLCVAEGSTKDTNG